MDHSPSRRCFLSMNELISNELEPFGCGRLALDDRQNVIFPHQQVLLIVDRQLFGSVAGKNHPVAHFELQLGSRTIIQESASAYTDNHASTRLILGRIWEQDAACSGFLRAFSLDHNTIADWLDADLTLFLSCGRH